MAALKSTQTSLQGLLAKIVEHNDHGQHPSKADLTRGELTQTRAKKYQDIDRLVALGLVENVAQGGNAYELRATDAGREEAKQWT